MNAPALLNTLVRMLGPSHVLTGNDAGPFCTDQRKRYHGQALCVARPANTEEVAQVVKACAEAGVAVVPQGGNTGLVGGATPLAAPPSVILSLRRMNRVRRVDGASQTLTAEAGCTLQQVQQAAADAGWLYPLRMGSEGSCTVGGNLATNAGGTQVLRYGNARELCLGLEVVTPQGDIWDGLTGLRKDNTGYDLRNLFIGSEGTLGIITAATMKLFPQPVARLTAFAAVPSMQAAVRLLGLAHQHLSAGLTGFEVMGQFALSLVVKHMPQLRVPFAGMDGAPYCVLLENSDSESEAHARQRFESLLELAFEDGCVLDAVVAENLSQAHDLWHVRESIPLAQAQEGLNIKHDISVPTSRIPAFVEHADALLQREIAGVRLVNFGHLGDGNLHYNVQAPEGADGKAFLREQEPRVNALVYDAVAQFGGSFSAEHGVGQLKTPQLEQYESPVALSLMRSIKQALDPQNIMNPGCMLAKD